MLEKYNQSNNTKEISIGDLLAYLLGKWKQIVIGTILMCCVLCIYGFISNKNNVPEEENSANELTEESIKKAESAFKVYEEVYDEREKSIDAFDYNIIFQVNTHNTCVQQNCYLLTSDSLNVFKQFTLINNFTEDEKKELHTIFAHSDEISEWTDLVNVYTIDAQNTIISNIEDNFGTVLVVETYANSYKQCSEIMDILEKHISEQCSNSDYANQLIDSIQFSDNSFVLDKINKYTTNIINLNNQLNGLVSPSYLSTDELSYYKSLVSGEITLDGISETTIETKVNFNIKKYILVGIFMGLLMMSVIYLFIYLLGRNTNTEEDVEAFGFQSLGIFDYSLSSNSIVKKLQLQLRRQKNISLYESIAIATASINNYLKTENESVLYIAYDVKSEAIQKAIESLKEKIEDKSIAILYGNPLMNSSDFDEFLSQKCVLLLQEIGVSKLDNLLQFRKITINHKIPVVGAILVR